MRLLALAALSSLAVAACSPSGDTEIEATEVAAPPPTLAGVDLSQPVRALGTEPFWSLELNGTEEQIAEARQRLLLTGRTLALSYWF